MKINLPYELKKRMVEDWESITQQNMLVEVPAQPTVASIIEHYIAALRPKGHAVERD